MEISSTSMAAQGSRPPQQKMTDEQILAVDEILAEYNPETLSESNIPAIHAAFDSAGI